MNAIEVRGIKFLNKVFEGRVYKYAESSKGDLDIGFISQFKDPETLNEFLDKVEKAINGNFDQIENPDVSSNIDIAFIAPDCIEYYDQDGQEIIGTMPLQDFKDLVQGWRDFLLTQPLNGSRSYLPWV